MEREEIYDGLRELIPESKRRASTARVSEMFNALLDQLVEIQHSEAMELLLDEQEVGYGL